MNTLIDLPTLSAAADKISSIWPEAKPRCGIILGSGWGEAIKDLEGPEINYSTIPGLGTPGVTGHFGQLRHTIVNEMEIFIFQGRRHWYEGKGWTPVIIPSFVLHAFGAETLLLTNAAGGINPNLEPGSLMSISDHINMLGSNPLIGPHKPELGLRFPDQSEVYNKELRQILINAGADAEGVYLATTGPTFETPAEIRMFSTLGADAVGMSTVPEAIVANALGIQVAGLSCISNWAAGISPTKLTMEEVTETANHAMPRMKKVIHTFLSELSQKS